MSDTPFSDQFKDPIRAGYWWHVSYLMQNGYGQVYCTKEFSFNVNPQGISLSRLDYIQYELNKEHPDSKIMLLGWSLFESHEESETIAIKDDSK